MFAQITSNASWDNSPCLYQLYTWVTDEKQQYCSSFPQKWRSKIFMVYWNLSNEKIKARTNSYLNQQQRIAFCLEQAAAGSIKLTFNPLISGWNRTKNVNERNGNWWLESGQLNWSLRWSKLLKTKAARSLSSSSSSP